MEIENSVDISLPVGRAGRALPCLILAKKNSPCLLAGRGWGLGRERSGSEGFGREGLGRERFGREGWERIGSCKVFRGGLSLFSEFSAAPAALDIYLSIL